MELRESSTSEAVSRCCGSRTSSFRIKHTVFSETRPSLGQTTCGEPGVGTVVAGWTCWEHRPGAAGATTALSLPHLPTSYPSPAPASWCLLHNSLLSVLL